MTNPNNLANRNHIEESLSPKAKNMGVKPEIISTVAESLCNTQTLLMHDEFKNLDLEKANIGWRIGVLLKSGLIEKAIAPGMYKITDKLQGLIIEASERPYTDVLEKMDDAASREKGETSEAFREIIQKEHTDNVVKTSLEKSFKMI